METELRIGDIIEMTGKRYFVKRSTESSATIHLMDDKSANPDHISQVIDTHFVVERKGEAWVKEFLASKTARRKEQQISGDKESENDMEAKTKKTPRGGLYADKVAAEGKRNGSTKSKVKTPEQKAEAALKKAEAKALKDAAKADKKAAKAAKKKESGEKVRLTDDQVKDFIAKFIKNTPEAELADLKDQKITDALRATGNGCSNKRLALLRKTM